jgi:hypothetical protein
MIFRGQEEAEAEVDELYFELFVDEDVFEFEVAVYDAFGVEVG